MGLLWSLGSFYCDSCSLITPSPEFMFILFTHQHQKANKSLDMRSHTHTCTHTLHKSSGAFYFILCEFSNGSYFFQGVYRKAGGEPCVCASGWNNPPWFVFQRFSENNTAYMQLIRQQILLQSCWGFFFC